MAKPEGVRAGQSEGMATHAGRRHRRFWGKANGGTAMMQKMVTRVFRNLATTRCSIRRRFDGIALKGGDGLH